MNRTPGPWTNREGTIYSGDIPVAGIIWDVATPQQQPFNAALIAEAPEMHRLLVETLQTLTTALEAGALTDGLYLAQQGLQALLARLEEK